MVLLGKYGKRIPDISGAEELWSYGIRIRVRVLRNLKERVDFVDDSAWVLDYARYKHEASIQDSFAQASCHCAHAYNGLRAEMYFNCGTYPSSLISSTRRSKKACSSSAVFAT